MYINTPYFSISFSTNIGTHRTFLFLFHEYWYTTHGTFLFLFPLILVHTVLFYFFLHAYWDIPYFSTSFSTHIGTHRTFILISLLIMGHTVLSLSLSTNIGTYCTLSFSFLLILGHILYLVIFLSPNIGTYTVSCHFPFS